jgi:hypothetical protein
MNGRPRTVVAIIGALFTIQGVGWVLAPARTAGSLGMPLLDGLGRSTQVGDFASFFLTAGIAMLIGSRPGNARVLYFPAALIGGAAVLRTLAWLLQGAAFAGTFIVVEVLVATILYRAAQAGDPPA